jgi:hypothetical protein
MNGPSGHHTLSSLYGDDNGLLFSERLRKAPFNPKICIAIKYYLDLYNEKGKTVVWCLISQNPGTEYEKISWQDKEMEI